DAVDLHRLLLAEHLPHERAEDFALRRRYVAGVHAQLDRVVEPLDLEAQFDGGAEELVAVAIELFGKGVHVAGPPALEIGSVPEVEDNLAGALLAGRHRHREAENNEKSRESTHAESPRTIRPTGQREYPISNKEYPMSRESRRRRSCGCCRPKGVIL